MSAPGFYPDPEGSMTYRYWDGRRWTDDYGGPVPKGVGRPTIIVGSIAAVIAGFILFQYVLPGCGVAIRPVDSSEVR